MAEYVTPIANCSLCPRQCGANRVGGERGFCGAGAEVVVSHYGPHFGEEPPISGRNGAGNIFFSPCNLRCIFCQNHQISHRVFGKPVSSGELAETFLALQGQGVHNINLVSPTPYAPQLADAIRKARRRGVTIPFVYNTNAYESMDALDAMDGLIDIYLPDFKYWHESAARRLSHGHKYPETAQSAIMEMKRQVGDLAVHGGIASKGLLIRLLVLPGNLAGTKSTLRWIRDSLGAQTFVSIMSQYYPLHQAHLYPMVARPISKQEYDGVIDFAIEEGFRNIFGQEMDSAPLYVPDFEKDEPFGRQGF